MHYRRFFAVVISALLAPAALAADWPQWRGPNRDGISAEAGLLKAWPADGPKQVWRTDGIGAGYSTPAVAGGRVYLMSNEGLDAEFVRCYTLTDGKLVWSSEKVGRVGNPNQRPSYPAARCTPAIDGDLLYAIGSDGDLVCLETATGKLKWKKSFRNDFGGKPGEWAYSESPLVDGNKVIVTPGGGQATVVALDKLTGNTIWKFASPNADEAGYSSPVVAEIAGSRQIVQFIGKGVIGLDAATGTLLWTFADTVGRANMTTPIVHEGHVYTGGGLGTAGLAKISVNGGKWSAAMVYVDKKLPMSNGGVVRIGEYLYGSSQAGLTCAEFKTGAIKWSDRSIGPSALSAAGDRLYLHSETGTVALVEASPEAYREHGRFTPPNIPAREAKDKAYAHPVIVEGKLLIRDGASLLCYDIAGK
ncbi:PQQ-binding-like beta-propeller repeat protein [Humisphaera borealis]|uniref:PQQ-like beta-propeller repeat protein n=1 Tax=Humisphaera borealis TaxID=2807512 RepID=A0A7M2WXV8_9BACT|nr:PQQ-binding-like beta-propeller repeat protein [Humisphaera borealis]QOV90249.1 PQQ-like beta-propeller repeat protein [Humisphaera borealis]